MKTKINWSDAEGYEAAITQWIVKHLKSRDIKETHFSREAGLGKNETDARTFRKLKEGKRHWSLIDLCKLAGYFGEKPSAILEKVERFYQSEGILIPGQTADQIIGLGLFSRHGLSTLISTWGKRGKFFELIDCDPGWKRAAKGEINRIIGLTSKEIFPKYPEITASLEKVWKEKGADSVSLWYDIKTDLEKRLLQSTARKRRLSINTIFVPPDRVVSYVVNLETTQKQERP